MRDNTQHVTVTVVIYNTVAGGVPSAQDVNAAIEDMEALYRACGWAGRLADSGANFMKSELTVNDALTLQSQIKARPYKSQSMDPVDGDIFPIAATVQAQEVS